MMLFYSLGLALALAVSSPWWLVQMLRSGRYREGLLERFGRLPARLRVKPGSIWLHAVSVGEVLAAQRLVADLEQAGLSVCVSTTTRAGQQLARQRFGEERVFYFPLDFAFAVRAYLRRLQPSMLLLMESELWPRVLVECERAAVPLVVANARVSDRSFPRYMRLRSLWQRLLAKVRVILAQSEEDVRRWQAIGAKRVESVGNLKYDVQSPQTSELIALLKTHLPQVAPLLVSGSTLEGEEAALLECWKQCGASAVMLFAPRHPQRFEAVAKLLEESGVQWQRLSAWRRSPTAIAAGTVLLLDSIGELASLYSMATVAFVGGSLIDAGGHNPLEPAQFGVPVLAGPSYTNFRAMVEAMIAAQAIQIVTLDSLCSSIRNALTHPDIEMGERGKRFYESQAGATQRTVDQITAILREGRA